VLCTTSSCALFFAACGRECCIGNSCQVMSHSSTLCCHLVKIVVTISLELHLCLTKAGAMESLGPIVCFMLIPVSIVFLLICRATSASS